ncbi:MAG: hypothetical protein NVS3B7_04480 [Candidatus Elarobacter sp.]
MSVDKQSSVSRGLAIKRLAVLPVAVFAVGATLSAAQAADNKKQFKYQDKPGPKGAKCSGCSLFKKPNACSVVTGKISPNGWCIAYAAGKSH